MTTTNRRRAERVHTGFPVKLLTPRTFVEGEAVDISRTGMRVRLPALALGLDGPVDAQAAGARVSDHLADAFTVNLHHEKLGPLLPRNVRLMRVGLPADAPGAVDLCCEFREPLGDEEAAVLEIELPPVDDDEAAWCEAADLPQACDGQISFDADVEDLPLPEPKASAAPTAPRLATFRAFVGSTRPDGPPVSFCRVDLVTAVGVRVQMPRKEGLGPRKRFRSLRDAAEAFVDRFGAEVDLRLVDDEGDVWSGPARVSGVELPGEESEMLVTLAFDRRLRPSELRKLGLVQAA